MPRLAVLQLALEANTFSTQKTTIEWMAAGGGIHHGQEMVEVYGQSNATLAGYLDPNVPEDVQIVPLVGYRSGANGEFTAETFDRATAEMVSQIEDNGPFDGVLLSLHGGGAAEGIERMEAETAKRVRAAVGPDVPIGVVFDMHCNVDPDLVETADAFRIYQTNPHIDAKDRALEVRALILELIAGTPKPRTAFQQLPLIVNIVKQDTSDEPMRSILARTRELEQLPGMLDVSIAEGFPYADVEHMGMSVLASHRTDLAAAQAAVDEIAGMLWAAREELQGTGVTPEQALLALDHSGSGKPTLLLDVGDNVGGGSRGDSTTILNEAVRLGVGNFVISLWDPDTVASLADTPIGARVDVTVAGKSAEQEGFPQPLTAVLIARSDGKFADPGPTHGGALYYDAGPMVALRTDDNIVVVLTSLSMGTTSPEQFRSIGVEPTEFAAVVAKGVNSPKAGFGPLCGDQVMIDTPGVTRLSVEKFDYRHRRRPMYPYEPDTTFP